MKFPKLAALAGTVMLASTSAAFAGSITQVYSFGPTLTNWGLSPNTYVNPDFLSNPVLAGQAINFAAAPAGLLTGVSITITETLSGSMTVQNNGSSPTNYRTQLTNTLGYDMLGNINYFTDPSSYFNVTGIQPGSVNAQTGLVSGVNTTTVNYSTGSLVAFESTWTGYFADEGDALITGGANGTSTYTDNGTISVAITYTYAPEPISAALLGSGLLALGLVRRRRRQA